MGRLNAPPTVPRPRLAHRAEFWALRAALGALSRTDWRRAGDIGARLALLGYRPFGIRRVVVEKQVAAAFPELGAAAVTAIARGAYEHLGRVTGMLAESNDKLPPELGSCLAVAIHGYRRGQRQRL